MSLLVFYTRKSAAFIQQWDKKKKKKNIPINNADLLFLFLGNRNIRQSFGEE